MSQRDDYVRLLVAQIGRPYSANGPCRCHGTCPGWDCSGLLSGDPLEQAGGPFVCGNTDTLAAQAIADNRLIDRATCRATAGTWAIRLIDNPTFPGHGHMVCSLGDGTTVEAHSHVDGVIHGTFDGNRGFTVFCLPPGIAGFAEPAPPVPVIIPPTTSIRFSEETMPMQVEKSVKLDSHGNGFFDLAGLKASRVRSLMVVGTVDPSTAHGYQPIPRLGLTISPASWARVVIEGGIPSGPASVRIIHD